MLRLILCNFQRKQLHPETVTRRREDQSELIQQLQVLIGDMIYENKNILQL